MRDFLIKIKSQVSVLPKIYRVYFAVLLLAELFTFSIRPDEPGLYSDLMQFLPFAIALGFLCSRESRMHFRRHIYTYGILQFISLAL